MYPVEEDANGDLCYASGVFESYNNLRAVYVEEPPDDLRKSNFFRFIIQFRGMDDEVVDIEEAKFLGYMNESYDTDLRNGMKYSVVFKYPNGIKERKDIFITLLDAVTLEPIKYEGQDDSPKMKRVLLTHETICSRCSQQKSCGNKNEAPSDPLKVGKGNLKFFLKCNQNCLKGAGNPKDMRRFSIAMSFNDITRDRAGIIIMSKKIFVHNNSKHSRKRKRVPGFDPSLPIRIVEMYPKAGTHGTTISVFGENLSSGLQVCVGSYQIPTQMVSQFLIRFDVPFMYPATYPVSLRLENEKINIGTFHYESPEYLAHIYPKVGVRGEEIVILRQNLANQGIQVYCNGQILQTKVLNCSGLIAVIPHNAQLGSCDIFLVYECRQMFWFKYQICDRSQPGFSPKQGFLTLYNTMHVQNFDSIDDSHYNGIRPAHFPWDCCYSSLPPNPGSNNNSSAVAPCWYASQFSETGQEQKEATDYSYDVQGIRQLHPAPVEGTIAFSKQTSHMLKNMPNPPYFNGSSSPEIPMN